ncbi:MAG: YncE family protein [candidate division Zixibacteria bacterium]|nr:YncE family protein [candidate division Zixibacteria bacterium]HHI03659.1 YncE family protein [candidate division Zixibacteria bacterium]
MRKFLFISLFVLALMACSFAANYLYVVNGTAETMSRVNIETGAVENHVTALGVVPNQIVYHDDRLYVVNSLSASLMVINPANNSVINEFPLPVNSNPYNIALSGNFAYVTGFASASVYKVNINNGSIADTYTVGLSPEGLIAYDGRLYIANTAFDPDDYSYGQGSVSIIDLSNGSTIDQVNIGKNPQFLAAGPGDFINIVCSGDYSTHTGMVYFLNPQNNTLIDSLSTGGNPGMLAISSDGIGYIAAGGWVGDGHVYSYNAVSRTILRDASNPITVARGAIAVAVDSVGMIYSAGQMVDRITKFDYQGNVIANYSVGDGPVSMVIIDERTYIETIDDVVPDGITLGIPYPNPFNSSVCLKLEGNCSHQDNLIIDIYNCNGKLVNKLSVWQNHSISNNVIWPGIDYNGCDVASGVYFARIRGTLKTVKMVLLR